MSEDMKHPELFSGASVLLQRILTYIKAKQNQSPKCKSPLCIISYEDCCFAVLDEVIPSAAFSLAD